MAGDETCRVWCNGEAWVVAGSAEEAERVYVETCAEPSAAEPWGPVADDRVLRVDDGAGLIERTAAEWASDGPAFLGSTDW